MIVTAMSTLARVLRSPIVGMPTQGLQGLRQFPSSRVGAVRMMALKTGIVGLPNVGKSTLFNALMEDAQAQAANFPFCTIEPNVGVVVVPDDKLGVLAKISSSAKVVPTSLSFVDIAGLVEGASKGEGLGNKFLANIRECDAIVHVVRCHPWKLPCAVCQVAMRVCLACLCCAFVYCVFRALRVLVCAYLCVCVFACAFVCVRLRVRACMRLHA